jgi:hypothetical protein
MAARLDRKWIRTKHRLAIAADIARENWTPIDQSAADEGAAILQLDVLRPRRRRRPGLRQPIQRDLRPSVTIETRKVVTL